MKKYLLTSALVAASFVSGMAQDFKTKVAKNQKIRIEIPANGVQIIGHNSDELVIQTASKPDPLPEKAKGLKPLYNSAVDNSGIGLAVVQENNEIKIEKAVRKEIKYVIKVPKNSPVIFVQTTWLGAEPIHVSDLSGNLEIKSNNANLILKQISGSVVASSTSGDIEVQFSQLDATTPTAISNISGSIDISLPVNTKATFSLRSISGEIYSDLDIVSKKAKDGLRNIGGGSNVAGTLNGGGVAVTLNNISGDVFLRKQ